MVVVVVVVVVVVEVVMVVKSLLKCEWSILGPERLLYIFLNNIFNLKGNCVTHINTYVHTYTQG